jgi:hypothetical protein
MKPNFHEFGYLRALGLPVPKDFYNNIAFADLQMQIFKSRAVYDRKRLERAAQAKEESEVATRELSKKLYGVERIEFAKPGAAKQLHTACSQRQLG